MNDQGETFGEDDTPNNKEESCINRANLRIRDLCCILEKVKDDVLTKTEDIF